MTVRRAAPSRSPRFHARFAATGHELALARPLAIPGGTLEQLELAYAARREHLDTPDLAARFRSRASVARRVRATFSAPALRRAIEHALGVHVELAFAPNDARRCVHVGVDDRDAPFGMTLEVTLRDHRLAATITSLRAPFGSPEDLYSRAERRARALGVTRDGAELVLEGVIRKLLLAALVPCGHRLPDVRELSLSSLSLDAERVELAASRGRPSADHAGPGRLDGAAPPDRDWLARVAAEDGSGPPAFVEAFDRALRALASGSRDEARAAAAGALEASTPGRSRRASRVLAREVDAALDAGGEPDVARLGGAVERGGGDERSAAQGRGGEPSPASPHGKSDRHRDPGPDGASDSELDDVAHALRGALRRRDDERALELSLRYAELEPLDFLAGRALTEAARRSMGSAPADALRAALRATVKLPLDTAAIELALELSEMTGDTVALERLTSRVPASRHTAPLVAGGIRALAKLGELTHARALAERALRSIAESPDLFAAMAATEPRGSERARTLYARAANLYRMSGDLERAHDVDRSLADALVTVGRGEDARALLERAIDERPSAALLLDLARIEQAHGRVAGARGVLARALAFVEHGSRLDDEWPHDEVSHGSRAGVDGDAADGASKVDPRAARSASLSSAVDPRRGEGLRAARASAAGWADVLVLAAELHLTEDVDLDGADTYLHALRRHSPGDPRLVLLTAAVAAAHAEVVGGRALAALDGAVVAHLGRTGSIEVADALLDALEHRGDAPGDGLVRAALEIAERRADRALAERVAAAVARFTGPLEDHALLGALVADTDDPALREELAARLERLVAVASPRDEIRGPAPDADLAYEADLAHHAGTAHPTDGAHHPADGAHHAGMAHPTDLAHHAGMAHPTDGAPGADRADAAVPEARPGVSDDGHDSDGA